MLADLLRWVGSPAAEAVVGGLCLLYMAAGYVLGRVRSEGRR